MQVNGIGNHQIINKNQNFKGNTDNLAAPSSFKSFSNYQTLPLNVSRAYAAPQIPLTYKEIESFDVPHVGNARMYELANGHKVILIPKLGPTIILTAVKVGELNETANIKESSHLLEHLIAGYCIKPKDKETEDIISTTGAECNAATSDVLTYYHIKAPITDTDIFEKLIKIQSETLQNSNFTTEQVENEKDIIIQELNERGSFTENWAVANRLTIQNLFNLKDSDDLITPESIEGIKKISKENLADYYNTFYKPNNMITTVIGAVDENTIKTVAKHIGKMKNPPLPTVKTNYPKIPTDNPLLKTIRKDIQSLDKEAENTYTELSFIGPKPSNQKDILLAESLKWVINGRIHKEFGKNDDKIYTKITSDIISTDKNCPTILKIESNDRDKYTEDNLKEIYSIVHDLTQNPISETELKIMKDKTIADASVYAEDSFIFSVATSEEAALSMNLKAVKDLSLVKSITAEEIQGVAKKYLDLNKASLVVVHPQEKPKTTPFDKVKSANRPTFTGNIDPLQMKDVHEYVLPNNLRVVIDSRPGIARSTIKFDLNSQKNLYNNPDSVSILAYCLASKETKQKLEDQGISLEYDANAQEIYTELNGSSDKTIEMLGYATGILMRPNLVPEDFDRIKKNIINYRKNEPKKGNFESTPSKVYNEWIKGSPYILGAGSINDLEFVDVKNLHQQILQNAQGTVFITIPQEKLKDVKSEIFKQLMTIPTLKPRDYAAILNKYKPKPIEKNKIFTEEKNNNKIEIEKIFKIVESGNIKDRAGLMILNNVLGGREQSKLFKLLRNEDRLTYGAYSYFNHDESTGNIAKITLATTVSSGDKNNLKKVIEGYNKCTNELINKQISQDEIDKAKAALKSKLLCKLESSEDRNLAISSNYNSFYGIMHQQALLDAIEKMTPEYVQDLAKYYLTQPYLMSVVGNKDAIDENKEYLSALGEVVST